MICRENERVTVVGHLRTDDDVQALDDMLRYEGRCGTVAQEFDQNTKLFTATYITATWTPERWRSFGIESIIHEEGAPIICGFADVIILDARPCKHCGDPEAGHTGDGYCLNRRRPSYEPVD